MPYLPDLFLTVTIPATFSYHSTNLTALHAVTMIQKFVGAWSRLHVNFSVAKRFGDLNPVSFNRLDLVEVHDIYTVVWPVSLQNLYTINLVTCRVNIILVVLPISARCFSCFWLPFLAGESLTAPTGQDHRRCWLTFWHPGFDKTGPHSDMSWKMFIEYDVRLYDFTMRKTDLHLGGDIKSYSKTIWIADICLVCTITLPSSANENWTDLDARYRSIRYQYHSTKTGIWTRQHNHGAYVIL